MNATFDLYNVFLGEYASLMIRFTDSKIRTYRHTNEIHRICLVSCANYN